MGSGGWGEVGSGGWGEDGVGVRWGVEGGVGVRWGVGTYLGHSVKLCITEFVHMLCN